MHSLTKERLEVVRDLDHFAATEARESEPSESVSQSCEPYIALFSAHSSHTSWWTC